MTAIRNIRKHKAFSIINILGLAAGMAVCILIILYVQYELSYDKFHKDYKQIYRIGGKHTFNSKEEKGLFLPAGLKSDIADKMPEVKSAVRIYKSMFTDKTVVRHETKTFYESDILETEQSFFDVFDFEVKSGGRNYLLANEKSAVITEEMAEKYFGNENPVGQIINVGKNDYQITGVLKNIPGNSHLKFNILLSYDKSELQRYEKAWGAGNYYIYVKLLKGVNTENFRSKLEMSLIKMTGNDFGKQKIFIQPVESIHLNSDTRHELSANSSYENLYIFSSLGILVLILACINFINLSTSRSIRRTGEVGLRKAIGANKLDMIKQFISESMLIAFFSVIISIVLAAVSLEWFNKIAETDVQLNMFAGYKFILGVVALVLIIGVLGGAYPAFYLSSFNPLNILKDNRIKRGSKSVFSLKKTLVVAQFVITSSLIAMTIIMVSQLGYIKNKNLGYDKEQVLIVPMRDYKAIDNFILLKSRLKQYNTVKGAALASGMPVEIGSRWGFHYEGRNEEKGLMMPCITIDSDYLKTLGIKLIAGRNVSEKAPEESDEFIINEAAAKFMGLKDPVGKKMWFDKTKKGEIVGVVKDFNFASLHNNIEPLVMFLHGNSLRYMFVKSVPSQGNIIDLIKKEFTAVIPDKPFEYIFLDEKLAMLYEKEEKLSMLIEVFSTLSIIIASVGMLGLIMFSIENRRKEIGIRKVIGAKVSNILYMISSEYLILILAANLIAVPITYYFMKKWLEDFAYKTDISWWIFLLAMAVSFIVAMLAISWQTIKAASANPVDSIRYE